MNDAVYSLDDIVMRYGDREVCRVSHLDVPPGSITVVMGPNGAGKSTLLRMMGFLDSPTVGDIHFRGELCTNGSEPSLAMRRRVTMVFQSPALFQRSVEKNVAYGLEVVMGEACKVQQSV